MPQEGKRDQPVSGQTFKQFHTKSSIGTLMKRGEDVCKHSRGVKRGVDRFETTFIFPPDIARQLGGEREWYYICTTQVSGGSVPSSGTQSEAAQKPVRRWKWASSAWKTLEGRRGFFISVGADSKFGAVELLRR